MRDTQQNIEHAASPQAGDYWEDHFCPVALVLDAGPYHVSYLEKTKAAGDHHWRWDTSCVTTKTPAEFQKWLRYGSIPGTWADVHPNWAPWRQFADEALAAHGSGVGGAPSSS